MESMGSNYVQTKGQEGQSDERPFTRRHQTGWRTKRKQDTEGYGTSQAFRRRVGWLSEPYSGPWRRSTERSVGWITCRSHGAARLATDTGTSKSNANWRGVSNG